MRFNIKISAPSSAIAKEVFSLTDFKNVDEAIKEASRYLCLQGNNAEIWNTSGSIVHTIKYDRKSVHNLLGKGFFQSHYPQELLK